MRRRDARAPRHRAGQRARLRAAPGGAVAPLSSTRLAELGDDWRAALAVPTNLFDASALMPRFTPPGDEVVEFGHTMNGGSLLSWAYFEIGSLIAMGRADAAWARARTILDRFEATALLEGCNYWDHRGRPSRARLEPFLSDVVLVASALPRWFVGVDPRLDRIDVATVPVQVLEGRVPLREDVVVNERRVTPSDGRR